jgi:hypothetical protein
MVSKNYTSRAPRFLKSFDKLMVHVKGLFISRYGDKRAETIIRESRQEYQSLVTQIPYIGNITPSLIFFLPAVRYLAVYRVLKKMGCTAESIGQLIYEIGAVEVNAVPGLIKRIIGYIWFSPWLLGFIKIWAIKSQKRKYSGDFVFAYVKSYGHEFDYGIDYIECAICKFFREQGALEVVPYVCAIDEIASDMLGWGLHRTMTISTGYAKCDFRFKKGGKTFVKSDVFLKPFDAAAKV